MKNLLAFLTAGLIVIFFAGCTVAGVAQTNPPELRSPGRSAVKTEPATQKPVQSSSAATAVPEPAQKTDSSKNSEDIINDLKDLDDLLGSMDDVEDGDLVIPSP